MAWFTTQRVIRGRDRETNRNEVSIWCGNQVVHVITGPTAYVSAVAFVELMNANGKTAPPKLPRTRADGWKQPANWRG